MKKSILFTLLLVTAALLGALVLAQDTTGGTTGGGTTGGASATDATATVAEDGTVIVTGVALPGESASVPEICEDEPDQTAKVVCTAEAFLETLSDEQQAEVVLDLTQENATTWSNLPVNNVPRNGVELGSLDETQLEAAYAVVRAAMGSAESNGYGEAMKILMADDVLVASSGVQGGGGPGGAPPSGGFGGTGGPPTGGMGPGGPGSGGPGGGRLRRGSGLRERPLLPGFPGHAQHRGHLDAPVRGAPPGAQPHL